MGWDSLLRHWVRGDLGGHWYLVAAVQRFLPQLQLQLAGSCVEVAADHGGLQLLLCLLILLQLNPALLQVPGRGKEDERKARFQVRSWR